MDIELYNGDAKAIISTHGGYITNLADENGDILYPKRTLTAPDGSEKLRGGCHVCLPNFGPGGESGLAQHGFGRISEWGVADRSETRVELTLAGKGDYMGMDSSLAYTLQQHSLEMRLTLKNKGTSPVKVSPAFHPYFFRGGQAVQLDGKTYSDLAEFAGTQFASGNQRTLQLAGRTLQLSSKNLPLWALWTDDLAGYFCVEPTNDGNAFADGTAQQLAPGKAAQYTFAINWA